MGMTPDRDDARGSPHRRTEDASAGQTELFPPAENDLRERSVARADLRDKASREPSAPSVEEPPPAPVEGRSTLLKALLEASTPVKAGGKAAAWLKTRRVFRKTWESQQLRVVDNYRRAADTLQAAFPLPVLQAAGLFNKDGHLRFYRHALLVPWFDGGEPVYLQAFAPEEQAVPPDLVVAGPIPCPYNARLLDGASGRLYLCAGAVDTLELLEAGFPAVGLPRGRAESGTGGGDVVLKTSWLARFRNKSVYVAFDGDADGEAAAATVIAKLAALSALGVEVHRLAVPPGKRIGDWMAGR
jgi:DNA primase